MNLAWQLKARDIVCGIAGPDGEPMPLTKQDMPEGLVSG